MAKVTTEISDEAHMALRTMAIKGRTTAQALVREWIELHVQGTDILDPGKLEVGIDAAGGPDKTAVVVFQDGKVVNPAPKIAHTKKTPQQGWTPPHKPGCSCELCKGKV